MKSTYTVAELAQELGTDIVTIRRWIAKDALHAEMDSKKGGYQISQDSLKKFLTEHPKYARLAARSELLGQVGNHSAREAALARVLKIVGSHPEATALPYLNNEIMKAEQELEAKELELMTIKENIAALKVIRNLIAHNEELPEFEEDSK